MDKKKINLVTTFSGYDSQALAMEMLKELHPEIDYELVAWCEIDAAASKAHDLIFPQWAGRNVGDITKVDWNKVKEGLGGEEVDLLTYSSPCQDISQAGKQMGLVAGSGTRSALLWNVVDAIEVLKPRFLLQENVKALVSKKFMPDFEKWMAKLDELGYESRWAVLNSKHYGVPQNRERVFCVSWRKSPLLTSPRGEKESYWGLTEMRQEQGQEQVAGWEYLFPEAVPLEKVLADVLEPEVDESYYLSDKAVEGYMKTSADFSHNHNFGPKRQTRPLPDSPEGGREIVTETRQGGESAETPVMAEEVAEEVGEEGGKTVEPRRLPEVVVGPSGKEYHLYMDGETPYYLRLEHRAPSADIEEKGEYVEERTVDVPLKMVDDEGKQTEVVLKVDPVSGEKRFYCCDPNVSVWVLKFRIRKLTNRECFRLMGVQEWAIDRLMTSRPLPEGRGVDTGTSLGKKVEEKLVISKTQLYKMAGNSIVVDVLVAIYEGLFVEKEEDMRWKRKEKGSSPALLREGEGKSLVTSGTCVREEPRTARKTKKEMMEELQLSFEW